MRAKIDKKSVFLTAILMGSVLGACQKKDVTDTPDVIGAHSGRLDDVEIADIDGRKIYLSDVEHAALATGDLIPGTSLTVDNPVFARTRDALIDQTLLSSEAIRRSLDQDDTTRRRLIMARERILSNAMLESLLAEKVTDDAVRRMYEEQSALQERGEQVRARHIVVATEEKAQELIKLIEQGGDFARLAKEYSLDVSTRDLGGDLGFFSKDALDSRISDIAFATNKGELSAPFQTDIGWHVFKVEARRQTPIPTFDQLKPEIVRFMSYDEIQKLVKTLRKEHLVSIKTPSLAPTHSPDMPTNQDETKDVP
jgi:peptidyl-prolyl cis-trans isomerase C